MKIIIATIIGALLLLQPLMGNTEATDSRIRTEQIKFPKGANSKVIKSVLKGDAIVDYIVRAAAGQTLLVDLEGSNPQNYMNINPPETDIAMFIGSMSGDSFQRILPTDGDYTVRVYLMRPAARRKESSDYTLTIKVTGDPLTPVSANVDAVLPGTHYHAQATITCTLGLEPSVKQCDALVIRRGFDGTATVDVLLPRDFKRRILFVKGRPVGSDAVEASWPMTFERKGDNTIVKFGTEEMYEIPDAIVFGG
jgi:hypothetical protein